jgi:uncharacterized protein YcbK (DUF882 family)
VSSSPGAEVTVDVTPVQVVHHKGKKVTTKKRVHVTPGHAVEPKSSPKLAASITTRLEVKPVVSRSEHVAAPKHTSVVATGKEIYIGGPTKPAAARSEKVAVDVTVQTKVAPKVATITGRVTKGGPMAKAGRAPVRVVAKVDDSDATVDEHPVTVSIRENGKPAAKSAAACLHGSVEFMRGAESDSFPMTRCDGTAAPLAAERLSVLVRPESALRPAAVADLAKVEGQTLAPGIRRVDSGLLPRMQAIVDHFAKPGMSQRVAIVSGYRPGSTGSFHASAQAIDFRLEGVPNEAVVDFCKTLDNTGCGYYPNSSFVHVDVRSPGSGHVAWIDASAPGEPAQYVATWPPPPPANVKLAVQDQTERDGAAPALPPLPGSLAPKADVRAPVAAKNAPLRLKDWE